MDDVTKPAPTTTTATDTAGTLESVDHRKLSKSTVTSTTPVAKVPEAPAHAEQGGAKTRKPGRPARPGTCLPFSARITTEAKLRLTQHSLVTGVSTGEILSNLILTNLDPVPAYLLRAPALGQSLAGRLLDAVQTICDKIEQIPASSVVTILIQMLATNVERMQQVNDPAILGIALHNERDGRARLRRARKEIDDASRRALLILAPGTPEVLMTAAAYQMAKKAIVQTLSSPTPF